MKLKIVNRVCAALMVVCMSGVVSAAQGSYDDWWWNPDMSGMGVSVGQKEDTLVVAWYHFDADRQPIYLMLSGRLDGNRLTGPLLRTRGPRPGDGYDSRMVKTSQAGTATLEFVSIDQAVLHYDYDGKSGQIPLQRFVFRLPGILSGSTFGAVYVHDKQCASDWTAEAITHSYALKIDAAENIMPQFVNAGVMSRGGGAYGVEPQVTYRKNHLYRKNGITLSGAADKTRFTCTYKLALAPTSRGWNADGSMLTCDAVMEGIRERYVEGTYSGPLVVNRVRATSDAYIADYSATTTNKENQCTERGWIVIRKQAS